MRARALFSSSWKDENNTHTQLRETKKRQKKDICPVSCKDLYTSGCDTIYHLISVVWFPCGSLLEDCSWKSNKQTNELARTYIHIYMENDRLLFPFQIQWNTASVFVCKKMKSLKKEENDKLLFPFQIQMKYSISFCVQKKMKSLKKEVAMSFGKFRGCSAGCVLLGCCYRVVRVSLGLSGVFWNTAFVFVRCKGNGSDAYL